MVRQALLCALLACVPSIATADAPLIAGPRETVFDWRSEACARWDIPDAPARAWRDAEGRVHLVAGSSESRAAIGPDLDHLEHGCAVRFAGGEDDDPGAYDDRTWLASVWTADGRAVTGLGHAEFHGHLRPELCRVQDYSDCWRNAVVALISDDGGRHFRQTGVVATLPYRYAGDTGRRSGYFNPSNILRLGDWLYAFVFAEASGAQKRGACLLLRPVLGDAEDWRAWDGAGFGVRFADPYRADVTNPAAHVCQPVPGIRSTLSSVVRHEGTGVFLAVTAATRPGPDGAPQSGFYTTTSRDLLAWSTPRLLLALPLLWRRDCAAAAAYAYPSLIDAGSRSRNFDTVGDAFWLYFVEMPLRPGCAVGPERDLVRLRVSWRGR